MLGAEVHGWRNAECEIVMQAQLSQYAHRESWTPTVSIANNQLLGHVAVVVSNVLQAYILHLQVLQMGTYEDAEVHGTQVYIGLVLHATVSLCNHCQQADYDESKYDYYSFHMLYNNVVLCMFIISITYKLIEKSQKPSLILGIIQNNAYLCITNFEYLLTNLK